MKRYAFTLIELLIAISILALLMAILLPVFFRVREKSRQAVCLSNEKQLGTAYLIYTHDNDQYVPPYGHSWAARIYPYFKNVGVFHCPSDDSGAQPPYYPVSYGIIGDLQYIVTLDVK